MSRRPRKPSAKGAKPTTDDRADDKKLWERWAESITARGIGKPRVTLGGPSRLNDSKTQASEPNHSGASPKNSGGNAEQPAKRANTPRAHKATNQTPHVPHLSEFDKKSRRRLSSGRVEISARIDLHGMRQHEAHDALLGFLRSARARGNRWVLVITGKGGAPGGVNNDDWSAEAARPRGVLRQIVPRWLSEPEFRALVVSHTTAARHHGGEGAHYVQLRTKKRRP